mgnify:CR=1 FL=1
MFRIDIEKYRKSAKPSKHTNRPTGLRRHRIIAELHLDGQVVYEYREFLIPDYKSEQKAEIAYKILECIYDLDSVNRYVKFLKVDSDVVIKQINMRKLPFMPKSSKPYYNKKQISTFRTLPLLEKVRL